VHTGGSKLKAIPIWGWPIFIVIALFGGRLVSIAGATSAITTANWESGILWGFGAAVVLGSGLWLARVRSADLALTLGLFFFVYVAVFSQVDYIDDSADYLFRDIHEEASDIWPPAWKSLPRDQLYRTFVARQVTPTGLFWLDHLRAQADIGVVSWEQQGHRRYGGRTGAEVYRQGIWMWWGWFCCYLLLLCGCFLGLFAAAFVEDKDPPVARTVASKTMDHLRDTLKSKGLSERKITSILVPPTPAEVLFDSNQVEMLLPVEDKTLAQAISADLQLARSWQSSDSDARNPDKDRIDLLLEIKSRFYSHNSDARWFSYHLVLLAADRLHRHWPGSRFIDALRAVFSIVEFNGAHFNVEDFEAVDLSGLAYTPVTCDVPWQPLYGRSKRFYDDNSGWEELERLPPEQIPRGAHLAILYQFCTQPDPRTHELWQGTRPIEIVTRTSAYMYDAIMTFLMEWENRFPDIHRDRVRHLASFACAFPQEQAEAFLLRCIESGWRSSVSRLPETVAWARFLDAHNDSPFGELSGYVDWYQPKKPS
jgi:hypothetical protein